MQKIHHLRAASRVAPRTAGLAAALVLLAACASGSGSGATGQVASIPSSGGTAGSVGQSSAAAVSSHPNLEGPALSEEATAAQIKAIEGPWVRCLGAHGTALALTPKLPGLPMPISTISAAARNACRSLQPHPPWQEIPADNPNYKLDMAKWINCMNARGVGVEATSAGPTAGGWTFTRSDEPANANQIEGQCEAKAFGA
jgi:hypothetical protein